MRVIERRDVPGTYAVVSGPNTYFVDARTIPYSCDCAAGCWTDKPCKHAREVQNHKETTV